MREDTVNFRNFNRDGAWLDFQWSGLDLDASGRFRLHSLPALQPAVDVPVTAVDPSAMAVAADGSVIVVDTATGGLLFLDACSGAIRRIPLDPPVGRATGVAISDEHSAVFVADGEGGLIAAYDWQRWTQMLSWSGFTKPSALAVDDAGNVFVADSGSGRVEKFSAAGDQLPFGDAVAATGVVHKPIGLCLAGVSVIILDGGGTVVEFDSDGAYRALVAGSLVNAMAVAGDTNAVYVAVAGAIDVYKRAGNGWERAGAVVGYHGPIASLTMDVDGTLLIDAGTASPPYRCKKNAAFAESGVLWSRALSASGRVVKWHSIEAIAEQPAGTLLQFAVYGSNDSADPPVNPGASDPFPPPWRKAPDGAVDFYVGDEALYIWIGVRWMGNDVSTPLLAQIRGEFDHNGYLAALPEIYREPPGPEVDFLTRFLALFESGYESVERGIENALALLDPQAAPADDLQWLASFLALPLPADASESRQRDLIQHAFTRYAARGTPGAIRNAILEETGIACVIEEPVMQTSWWSLAATPTCPPAAPTFGGLLGIDTVLNSVEPQGAVVGTTAVVDRSNLISDDEYGAPLFDEVAHRFTVRLYSRYAACKQTMSSVATIVEREKPAHTAAQICVIEPFLRIGFQAALGVDTVVGGALSPTHLGEGALVLAGTVAERLDTGSQLGITTLI